MVTTMRDDVLMQLSDRVFGDAAFRAQARTDLDGALRDAGFELNSDEMAAVREFHGSTVALSDEQLMAAMADPQQRRQFAA
jgi:hypothetical protein